MKPHHFALCAATCLVVLSSGYHTAESASTAAEPHTLNPAPLNQTALLSLAYAAGVVDWGRQQSEEQGLETI
ncbi:MAG: hypothetical protein AAGG51_27020 [Cyanobacteria bacterium P01_G01_bin.54]